MPPTDPRRRTPEEQAILEVQRVASICGEFSMAGCGGIQQFRATFPPWQERGETSPTYVIVQPEKVEGIYEAIWRRLRETPEYEPVKYAEQQASTAYNYLAQTQRLLDQARETLRTQALVIKALRLAMKDGPEYAGPSLPYLQHVMGLYLPKNPPEPQDDTT